MTSKHINTTHIIDWRKLNTNGTYREQYPLDAEEFGQIEDIRKIGRR